MDHSPFDELARHADTTMYVVTAASGNEQAGCLVGFATQCSIDPVRFLVCLSTANRTFEVASRAESLVVHVLHERDRYLARLFGEETGTDGESDKFDRCTWVPGPGGAPVVAGCDWFAGSVCARFELGDHVAFVLDVTDDGDASRASEESLGFQGVRDLEAGNPA